MNIILLRPLVEVRMRSSYPLFCALYVYLRHRVCHHIASLLDREFLEHRPFPSSALSSVPGTS